MYKNTKSLCNKYLVLISDWEENLVKVFVIYEANMVIV